MRLYSFFFFLLFFFFKKKFFGVLRGGVGVVRVLGGCLLVVYGRAEWIREVMWCEKL